MIFSARHETRHRRRVVTTVLALVIGCLCVAAAPAPASPVLASRPNLVSRQTSNGGKTIISPFANLTHRVTEFRPGHNGRFLVMGDIHGCLDEFNALIEAMQYKRGHDQLVLLGDLMAKGPDGIGVVRRARELGARCLRGNHDDKVIRIATYLRSHDSSAMHDGDAIPEGPVRDDIKWDNYHVNTARALEQDDYDYLQQCSLIMTVPDRQSLLVHAGLDPRVKRLEDQDPYYVMNMRSLDDDGQPVKHKKDGEVRWSDAWHQYGREEKVYYGHAASSGLQLKNKTFGIDTGCVYGGQLTALDVDTHKLYQTQCKQYTKHD